MPKTNNLTIKDAQIARQAMKQTTDKKAYPRLLVIALRGEGRKNLDISEITGFHPSYLPTIVKKYVEHGVKGLLEDSRTSNNRKVTLEEEELFLESYEQCANDGEVIIVEEMWKDFNETHQTDMTLNGFYRLLKRHGWRKIVPRTQHPKAADASTIEASKKLKLK